MHKQIRLLHNLYLIAICCLVAKQLDGVTDPLQVLVLAVLDDEGAHDEVGVLVTNYDENYGPK